MAVLDAADDLLEEVPRLVLQQAPLLDDVVEKLARLPCAVAAWLRGWKGNAGNLVKAGIVKRGDVGPLPQTSAEKPLRYCLWMKTRA